MSRISFIHTYGECATIDLVLNCGHSIAGIPIDPVIGARFFCPLCPDGGNRRDDISYPTEEQIDAIVESYAQQMEMLGLGPIDRVMCRRAAVIQNAWRVAFARVLK